MKKAIKLFLFLIIAFFSIWYWAYKTNPHKVCEIHPDPKKRHDYRWCGIGPIKFDFYKRSFIDGYAPKFLDPKERYLRTDNGRYDE